MWAGRQVAGPHLVEQACCSARMAARPASRRLALNPRRPWVTQRTPLQGGATFKDLITEGDGSRRYCWQQALLVAAGNTIQRGWHPPGGRPQNKHSWRFGGLARARTTAYFKQAVVKPPWAPRAHTIDPSKKTGCPCKGRGVTCSADRTAMQVAA